MIRAFAALGLASPAGRRAVSAGVATLLGALFAVAPQVLAAPGEPPASGAPSTVAALPRQFSVEVGQGGVLVADGSRLTAASELERWAQRALAGARFSGAVVFGDEARDGAVISDAVERLHRAGFAEVRRVGRA